MNERKQRAIHNRRDNKRSPHTKSRAIQRKRERAAKFAAQGRTK